MGRRLRQGVTLPFCLKNSQSYVAPEVAVTYSDLKMKQVLVSLMPRATESCDTSASQQFSFPPQAALEEACKQTADENYSLPDKPTRVFGGPNGDGWKMKGTR